MRRVFCKNNNGRCKTPERGGNFLLSPASAPGEEHNSIFDWTVQWASAETGIA